ncbi:MAG: hypothetical protein V1733_08780, partial [bacterium]
DGVREVHDAIRGLTYDKVISTITQSDHPNMLVNYTITRKNADNLEEFLREMDAIRNVKGTFFYFYTPVHGEDELFLNVGAKQEIIHRLLFLKARGYKIVNSRTALLSVSTDTWVRPNNLSYLYADNRLYGCCRAVGEENICRNCGYLGFAEIYQLSRLNFNAIRTALTYY